MNTVHAFYLVFCSYICSTRSREF